MLLSTVWGSLVIFFLCPLLGGLPLIQWITYGLTGRNLARIGTGNISVSAAFYHGGKVVGILAVLSEAAKGIIAVLLTRHFFPSQPTWELIALIALVMGRYWMTKGAGTTNVFWGMIAHDWLAALLTALIGGVSFTIVRDRALGRLVILFLLVFILSLRHPNQNEYIVAAMALVSVLAWILTIIPDDLDLPATGVAPESKKMFRFFRGDSGILSLSSPLKSEKAGQKAANLSHLKQLGYPVPEGWILFPGDDFQVLLEFLKPSIYNPLIVRSSAMGEDSETVSAAGQYKSFLNITNTEDLHYAIVQCLASYYDANALQYRQDKHQPEAAMAVLIQQQIRGVFSGVAFSRNPVNPVDETVIIEALPGDAIRVVSGRVTPEQYRINPSETPTAKFVTQGDIPPSLIEAVGRITREIETLYHGIPQDIEWSYDGQKLWILQARSITNLQPIWTRKIAAEVIPGVIRPLTWSINSPLTCEVWGDIFTLVLGRQAKDLDFTKMATLHYQRAYFNATLLGAIFLRMGLPPESLEFLTRGATFSKPPIISTLKNAPGLFNLLSREWQLKRDFCREQKRVFSPALNQLNSQLLSELSSEELLRRIETILSTLKSATYYSILVPLSLALRQAILKVSPEQLDNSKTPEIESMRSLKNLADKVRDIVPQSVLNNSDSLFTYLAENSQGKPILEQFQQWLNHYGYLSEVGTDISIPCWQEDPLSSQELFYQFVLNNTRKSNQSKKRSNWQTKQVQQLLDLKGKVTTIYSQLLAQLRWSFVALENLWRNSGILSAEGDIFYLELSEIEVLIQGEFEKSILELIQQRRLQFQQAQELSNIPYVVYGNITPAIEITTKNPPAKGQLQGIGASSGQVEGRVKIVRNLQSNLEINEQTILVVPYTDSGWTAMLSRAGGLIAEVGGCLSHGAIIAREYGIPAVMDVHHATQLLHNGQRVRIDGQRGIVEILEN